LSTAEIINLLVATIQGAGVGAVFLLILFIGVCAGFGFVKLRASGPRTLTVRSLDESLGAPVRYLPPEAPRGTSNQLAGSRKGA
jgi:hypothetical protein